MQKLNFNIQIKAPKSKVWDVLWNHDTYTQWTAPFGEGSDYTGEIKPGGKVHFLGPGGHGMYSTVSEMNLHDSISFRHDGVVKNGQEQPQDEETKKWSGSMEDYHLKENNGTTHLEVSLDSTDEYQDFFGKAFPKALEKVKELAEKN